jgi:putative transcription factor
VAVPDQRALCLPLHHSPLQKELALAINEKPTVIGEYESGRAIPNPSILSKLDRALGVHLPRPPKKK